MLSHRGLGQGLGAETGGRGAAGPSGRVPLGARERLGPPETAGLASAIPLGLLLFRCPRPVGSEPCGHRLRLLLEYLTPVVLHRTSAAERACGVVKQSSVLGQGRGLGRSPVALLTRAPDRDPTVGAFYDSEFPSTFWKSTQKYFRKYCDSAKKHMRHREDMCGKVVSRALGRLPLLFTLIPSEYLINERYVLSRVVYIHVRTQTPE